MITFTVYANTYAEVMVQAHEQAEAFFGDFDYELTYQTSVSWLTR